MRKYNSGEQTITIPLAEFQSLTLADKVLAELKRSGRVMQEYVEEAVQYVKEQDEVAP
jgi:hypothetical protein